MPSEVTHSYEFGEFRLDARTRRLMRDKQIVQLSSKAVDALLVLVQNPGELVERDVLMAAIWADTVVEDANLTVAISNLRKALGQYGDTAEYIETVPRIGYRFVADVRTVTSTPRPLIVEKRTRSRTVIEEELLQDERVRATADAARQSTNRRLTRWGVISAIAVAAAAITAVAALVHFRRTQREQAVATVAPPVSIKSIAVLPPKPLTNNQEDVEMSLGMADALITRLGATRKVLVSPTSAIIPYANANSDRTKAGRTLNVDAVLDGSLQRDHGRMRVTLRLLSTTTGVQLWEGNFDEADTGIFRLQDSISQQVAQALSLDLSPVERARLAKQQTRNAEAYVLYLKGNYYWSKRGHDSDGALNSLRKAIELDPNFAEAYATLAAKEATMSIPSPEADMFIEKALRLDDTLAEAHATYGFIRMFHHWDWTTAERELDRAIELNPGSATAHHWKGVYLSLRGRLDEAKAEMHRALELDPLSLIIVADTGQLHYFAHEFDQAAAYCNQALALDPDFEMAHTYLTDIYRMKGMDQEALNEVFKTDYQLSPPGTVEQVRAAFAREGWRAVYKTQLDSDSGTASEGHLPAFTIARAYCRTGDFEQALRRLDGAIREPTFFLEPYLNIDPLYDPMRNDPRFKEILRRMNLP
jgi:DNA-binding winged helix-turn-helix (wHTH) protein/TolB-like protein